jgi:hypothetical protein
LLEIDVSAAIGPQVGTPGANHLTVLAFTTPTITTDRILGMRFGYNPVLPAAAATLGANTFTGTQTAPAFAGSGTALTGVAKLTSNTFSGTQTIDNGNLDLDPSAPGTGRITRNGAVLLHTFGGTFLGIGAGNDSMSAVDNVGIGDGALAGITAGGRNVGIGVHASLNNTLGTANVAVGFAALENNQSGSSNVAIGSTALNDNTSGCCNTAVGQNALSRSTGVGNTALGQGAGILLTSGNNNLYLSHRGVDTESNTTRIGQPGTHSRLFATGVRNVTTGQANAIPVVIDSDGQLGTVSSSRRYKEDISDMSDASSRLLQLRPVTFRYTQAFADGAKPVQYGLIAEEVAGIFPELVVRDDEGRPETVQYQTLSVLLLNELQKQQARLAALERELAALRQERRR